MRALSSPHRKKLESSVLAARRAAEGASRAAIETLGVFLDRRPDHLDANQAALRNGLRAKWRQLGGDRALLDDECAYEQWHRLLFARFLAENDLLLHPSFKTPVTLADCEELAEEMDEPDAWSVAARFATEILPGSFRIDDPGIRLRLAPEGRHALEQILDAIPADTFAADDSLGWVYQFWQKDKKDEVNASERKIGGADLGPVTQLFTENYMVRFLLENSLGAWWAAHHPDSPLVKGFEYLRVDDDGRPAAGSFGRWPDRVAEVTVMDPCCGSGHFLVEAFSMLWQMRTEEEGLSSVDAQDAVLQDNLFGLELDPRCVQIAMFAVALQAWKAGDGWRQLPVPNIACSGIAVKAPVEEWTALADGDAALEESLRALHAQFQDAPNLGSLIDPLRPTAEGELFFVDYEAVGPVLRRVLAKVPSTEAREVGWAVLGSARAGALLARSYTLLTTNVPYLGVQRMPASMAAYLSRRYPASANDLATVFLERCLSLCSDGTAAVVSPLGWLYLKYFSALRKQLLGSAAWNVLAPLGKGAFGSISGHVVQSALLVLSPGAPADRVAGCSVTESDGPLRKSEALRNHPVDWLSQRALAASPDTLLAFEHQTTQRLDQYADSWQGLVTGDVARYIVRFWEVPASGETWERFVTAPQSMHPDSGRSSYLRWEKGAGALVASPNAHNFNPPTVLGRPGVLVAQMGELHASLYRGEMFKDKSVPLVPHDPSLVPALWAYCSSPIFRQEVRRINQSMSVGNGYFLKVPFDVDRWRGVAENAGLLPKPRSDDPTLWLFEGRPELSTAPLQVAVARLIGYRWPEQARSDGLDGFADIDGIVCLPSVAGEPPAADRVQQLLAAAYGESWSPARVKDLLDQAGSKKKNVADWLRDEFFKQHCALFGNRPFVWHMWDGLCDGFSALVNYHRLDRKMLEKLTYTYLGQDWVERQRAGVRDEVAGAEGRLSAALELQRKLERIIEGEKPFDIFVRWKQLHEQPVGWAPDVNDGVRLNVRPFVEASVLRAPFNVHWKKDRGKNPDGTERQNDKHLTLAAKADARKRAGRP